MIRLALTIGGVRITLFEIAPDDAGDLGPGASADTTLAPGFVPDAPWYDED